ncbi:MAG: YicC/YloC family endoribonuclease [Halieaceae bacterium]|nr:YicC/YloC family endoribonuclease [Halieaceae bacterium]
MNVNSMTAFARESDDAGPGSLAVEIRSVNHRYLDCQFKLPEGLRNLEPALRERLQNRLSRGKVEVQFRWQAQAGHDGALVINPDQLRALASAMAQVEDAISQARPPSSLEILHWPGLVEGGSEDSEALAARALSLFDSALETLVETRNREGTKLANFIRERLSGVTREVNAARERMPELLAQQHERMKTRVTDLGVDADPERLEQELAIVAQKADVDEELDRLVAHVEEVGRVLDKGGPCGRRLDFLMQELNREANTLSSKSLATSTTQNAVELKVLIEQMREQIQNLE